MFKKYSLTFIIFSFIISIFSISTSNKSYLYIYPIKNNSLISSYYGTRILYGKYCFHNGIDIPAIVNTPIYAIDSGAVIYKGFDSNGYGNYIIILHNSNYKSLYGHISDQNVVNLGQNINKGEIIAYVGPKILTNGKNNGNTTGPHLHFSVFTSKR